MGAADADKEDVISECVRQLSDVKTRELHKTRGNFLLSKKKLTFRISILFGNFLTILFEEDQL